MIDDGEAGYTETEDGAPDWSTVTDAAAFQAAYRYNAVNNQVDVAQWEFTGLASDNYEVFVVKSRAHFRRGFDETGFAKSIFVVDAPGSFVGTTRLDALDYQFAPIDRLYPFGTPDRR